MRVSVFQFISLAAVGVSAIVGCAPKDTLDEVSDDLAGIHTILVTAFGAVPNDGLDDSEAMQAAADYLCAHPGLRLVYPRGTYNLDGLVGWDEVAGDPRSHAISYDGCSGHTIEGYFAKIEVQGDFVKTAELLHAYPTDVPKLCRDEDHPTEFVQCDDVAEADNYQKIPFFFANSYGITIRGFELDGNADRIVQAEPNLYLAERSEYGLWFGDGVAAVKIEDVYVHHFPTDGIAFSGTARNVGLNRVKSVRNGRQGLSIASGVRNMSVYDSTFDDNGFVTEDPVWTTYTPHAPARGVDVEPESVPQDADWVDERLRVEGSELAGGILFYDVRARGNLGGQIAAPHGETTAFVTIRFSELRNRPGFDGDVASIGVVGGLIEDSDIYAEYGYVDICSTVGNPQQQTSLVFAAHVEQLAAELNPAVFDTGAREFSSKLRRNRIHGHETLVVCRNALPVVDLQDNQLFFEPDPPENKRVETDWYPVYGVTFVAAGPGCTLAYDWGADVHIERNTFHVPNAAPRRDFGNVHFCGPGVATAQNVFVTDEVDAEAPVTITYDHIGSVESDCFDVNGANLPTSGEAYLDDPEGTIPFTPYPLAEDHCLTLP